MIDLVLEEENMKKISKIKLKEFHETFMKRREELLSMPPKESIELVGGDEVDYVQNNIIQDMLERLSLRDKQALIKINTAIAKIKAGTFGFCDECGELISEKRLLAVPDCGTCIGCAEQQEKLSKQYRK